MTRFDKLSRLSTTKNVSREGRDALAVGDASGPDSASRRRLLSAGASLAVSPLLLAGCGAGEVDDVMPVLPPADGAPPATAVTPAPESTPGTAPVTPPVTPPGATPPDTSPDTRGPAPRYSAAAGGIGEFLTAKGWDRLLGMAAGDALIRQMQGQLKRHADEFAKITPTPVAYLAGSRTDHQPIGVPAMSAAQIAAAHLAEQNLSSIRAAAFDWRCHRRAETLLVLRNMLLAWARVHEPYGNPLIDETLLNPAVAYFHIREALSDADRAIIEPWLRKVVDRNRIWFERITADRKAGRNNWMSHGLCNIAVSALAIDSRTDLDWVASATRVFLAEHIEPGGETVDFRGRDALGYHCYSLRGLVLLAQAMNVHGVSLYDYRASTAGNGSMATAMAFLIPYIEKTRVHLEYVNSQYPPDKTSLHINQLGKPWQFDPGLPFPYADAYDPRWGTYARAQARADTPTETYLHRFPGYNPSWLFGEVTRSLSATYPEGVPYA